MALPEGIVEAIMIGAALLATVFACLLLFWLVRRFVTVKRSAAHDIHLKNLGNVTSVYRLSAESPDPRLSFRFLFHQKPLAEVPVPVPQAEAPAPRSPAKASRPSAAHLNQVEKSGRKAAQKTGQAGSFLSALGSLLPGKAGKALKSQGAAVRGVQTRTTQALGAKDQAGRQVNAVTRGASQLGVQPGAPASAPAAASPRAAAVQETSPPVAYRSVAQTVQVHPGESLALSLLIQSPRKRIPEGSYLYTVTSQQVPVDKVDREASPLNQQGMVYFPPVSAWRYALPLVLNVLIVAAAVFVLALIYGAVQLWWSTFL